MRAAIYGAGAMGTVLGAFITRAGGQIDLISRNEGHIAALKSHGAHITGTVDFIQPVQALLPSEMQGKYDIVFLMTKQSFNGETVDFLRNYLSEEGVIVTMQNGLPEEKIAGLIGKDNTYGCAVAWGANFPEPGRCELTSSPEALSFSLGCYGEADGRIDEISRLLGYMGKVRTVDNLIGARWAKLSLNAAFSGLSTLTGLTFGEISRDKIGRELALGVMNESFSVADAAGIVAENVQGHDISRLFRCDGVLRHAVARFLLPIAMKRHAALTSGMLHDLRKGRHCEIEYIDGTVRSFGERYGVKTPLCARICEMAHEIEDGKREITPENLRELTVFLKK